MTFCFSIQISVYKSLLGKFILRQESVHLSYDDLSLNRIHATRAGGQCYHYYLK